MDAQAVQHIPLFQRLSAEALRGLLAKAQVERYAKGALLFRQGQRAEAFWIVLEGWVHLTRGALVGGASRAVVLFTITPDEALCGISALESGACNLSAVAGTECRVVRLPAEAFNEALRHEPGFAYEALRLCVRRLQHMAQQYGSMAEPVSHRIVRAILRLHQQFGSTLPVTHRELAQMSWTTTESAIRAVRQLKRRGVIAGSRGRLTIRRRKVLAELVNEVDGRSTYDVRHTQTRGGGV